VKLEVIGHHVHNRNALPTFVQNALAIDDGAIVVRLASTRSQGLCRVSVSKSYRPNIVALR
jgi:hypothetical protein